MKSAHWIQRTHLFRADEFICSACRSVYNKPYKVCPKCGGRDPSCLTCGGSGYKGRVGIFEMMPMTETIREMIHKSASNAELRRTAIAEGMKTLAMDGADKVALGLTTESEIAAEAMI